MAIKGRRCSRCGAFFEPAQAHFRLCDNCHLETRAIDTNISRQRPGGADRMHGGRSRLVDDAHRRSLIFRGQESRERILAGFEEFATDYYRHPASLSAIFKKAGIADETLRAMAEPHKLDSPLMEFCPALSQWIYRFAGDKATELVIEYYGLYEDERLSLETLEYNLDLNSGAKYMAWTFGKLRAPDAATALGQIARERVRHEPPV